MQWDSYLHGEGYTERDTAAKLCCSKTVVHNAIMKFNADSKFDDMKSLSSTEDYT